MRGPTILLCALLVAGCGGGRGGAATACANGTIPLTIRSAGAAHGFCVEVARTAQEQAKGLMFRTTVPANGGMIFAPYPPDGGPPREASFWMENTPSPLDILFIRADGTIARLAENAVPFDRTPIPAGEPVAAVVELRGGRAGELGIVEGDRVSWPVDGSAAPR